MPPPRAPLLLSSPTPIVFPSDQRRSLLWHTSKKDCTPTAAGALTKAVRYYHFVCQLEDRFFVNGRLAGIFFAWFDWNTGNELLCESIVAEKLLALCTAAAFATQAAVAEPMDEGRGTRVLCNE